VSSTEAEPRRVYPGLDQLALRAVVVVGGVTAVVAAQAAGAGAATWLQGAVIGLAVLTALRPETLAGVGLLVGTAYVWALVPETLSPLVLLAAAGMVVAHVSALVVAQGPARMQVDGAQVRRWAGRALGLWLAAATVWGISVVAADLPQGRLAYALGLTVAVVVAVAATWVLSSRAGGR
jgi:hypothetical protein